jgi:hypothetical protein
LPHAASKGEAVNAQRKRAAERSPDIGRSLSPDTTADVEPKGPVALAGLGPPERSRWPEPLMFELSSVLSVSGFEGPGEAA